MNQQIQNLLEDIKNNTDKSITLYTMSHCPACNELKKKLDHIGVMYESVEMEGNTEMWDYLKKIGGQDYVPQVMVEGQLIVEYENVNELISKVISEVVGRRIVIN